MGFWASYFLFWLLAKFLSPFGQIGVGGWGFGKWHLGAVVAPAAPAIHMLSAAVSPFCMAPFVSGQLTTQPRFETMHPFDALGPSRPAMPELRILGSVGAIWQAIGWHQSCNPRQSQNKARHINRRGRFAYVIMFHKVSFECYRGRAPAPSVCALNRSLHGFRCSRRPP